MIDVLFCDLFFTTNHNYPIWTWYFFLVMSSINATMRYTKIDISLDFGVKWPEPVFDLFAWFTQIFSCFLSEYIVVDIIPFFPAWFSFLPSQRAASFIANQTTYTRIQGHAGGPGALHPAGPSLRPARPALDAHIPLWIKHWFRDLNRSQRETPAQWIRFRLRWARLVPKLSAHGAFSI